MSQESVKDLHVVSIGGGTGQSNLIRILRDFDVHISAIVAMADDGGSTGILRDQVGIVPPGDIRKCLVALAKDPDSPLAKSFERRFHFADDHSLGNLVLTALTQETNSFAEAIKICSKMLDCQGRVLPSTLENVTLCGETMDGMEFYGQVNVSEGPSPLKRVWLSPYFPEAYEPAIDAILKSDVILLGPGSLYSSVIPSLVVPGIIEAIITARKRRGALTVFIASKADMQYETWGMTAEEHVDALLRHGMEGILDIVFLHKATVKDAGLATRKFSALTGEQIERHAQSKRIASTISADEMDGYKGFIRPIDIDENMIRAIDERVGQVMVRDFTDEKRPTWHDAGKLKDALKGVFESVIYRRSQR